MAIIRSLLDTDWYKFTMCQAALTYFSDADVGYKFSSRGKENLLPYKDEIVHEVSQFKKLRFTIEEIAYLESQGLKPYFLQYLQTLTLEDVEVDVLEDLSQSSGLSIYVSGPWIKAIWFEVPLLAIINEIYANRSAGVKHLFYPDAGGLDIIDSKIECARTCDGLRFAEFGTRRRFSQMVQEQIYERLIGVQQCMGTSNVYLSKKYGTIPRGTMAHEWIQAGQAFVHPMESQRFMLDKWCELYGKAFYALTDTLGTDKFLYDYIISQKIGKHNFNSFRQDSGDPDEWVKKLSNRLGDLTKINAMFSDSLSIPKAIELYNKYHKTFQQISFGIGTNLSNDIPDHDPLNIVMKLVQVNDRFVAKLSDVPGKVMSESPAYAEYLKSSLALEGMKWPLT